MRILVLTQYYPPETGAPQNRLHSLALNLVANGVDVEVLTAIPSYPKMEVFPEYRGNWSRRESIDGIPIRRSWIYVTKSKKVLPRLVNYFSFVFSAIIPGLKAKKFDYILCESPPLFLGLTAVLLAKLRKAKMIFNVSDLWPESAEKLDIVSNKTLLKLAYKLEMGLYKRAHLVTGQTQGIVKDIQSRCPETKVMWLPNGIDEEVYNLDTVNRSWISEFHLEGKKLFMYAGILGHAQGLEVIIKAAKLLLDKEEIKFVLIGDGPLRAELENLNQEMEAGVVFFPNLPKAKVMQMVSQAYGYIVPLKKLDLFKGAIPSKLFDPLGLEVPILLGIEGEAKDLFIDEGESGFFFEPESDTELAKAVLNLVSDTSRRDRLGKNGREYVEKKFNRKFIAASFLSKLDEIRS